MKILSAKDYCDYIKEELDIDAVPLKKIFDDAKESSLNEEDLVKILDCVLASGAVPIYSPYSNKGHELIKGFSELLKMTCGGDYRPFAEKLFQLQRETDDFSMYFSFFVTDPEDIYPNL